MGEGVTGVAGVAPNTVRIRKVVLLRRKTMVVRRFDFYTSPPETFTSRRTKNSREECASGDCRSHLSIRNVPLGKLFGSLIIRFVDIPRVIPLMTSRPSLTHKKRQMMK